MGIEQSRADIYNRGGRRQEAGEAGEAGGAKGSKES